MVKLGLVIFKAGSRESPLFRCAEPAGTIHPHILVLQSFFPLFRSTSLFNLITFVPILSPCLLHSSSSSLTSYRILTNLPPIASTTSRTPALVPYRHRTACSVPFQSRISHTTAGPPPYSSMPPQVYSVTWPRTRRGCHVHQRVSSRT
jgi:hypothetical protein